MWIEKTEKGHPQDDIFDYEPGSAKDWLWIRFLMQRLVEGYVIGGEQDSLTLGIKLIFFWLWVVTSQFENAQTAQCELG